MGYGKNAIKREVKAIKREVNNFELAIKESLERHQKGSE